MNMTDEYNVPYIYERITDSFKHRPVSVSVPGSKSITNRALLLTALADGESVLNGAMLSGDSRVFIECLKNLGISVETKKPVSTNNDSGSPDDNSANNDPDNEYDCNTNTENDDLSGNVTLRIHGTGGQLPDNVSINVGSAGTAARFLTAMLGVSHGTYYLDSSDQMKKRPMAPLIESLRNIGCDIKCTGVEGHFPLNIHSDGFRSHELEVNIDDSSQFLSALLMTSVMSDEDITIHVTGSHGMAYIDMTVAMMSQFGVKSHLQSVNKNNNTGNNENPDICCNENDDKSFEKNLPNSHQEGCIYKITSGQKYHALTYNIEPDASAAAYFYAMSPLLGIQICVRGVHFNSLQGDIEFIRTLEKMGCHAEDSQDGIILYPPEDGILHGININMSAFSDQAITLSAIAPFADSPTTITGIGHIRKQESDRLAGIKTELGKMGIKTETSEDSITIYPGTPKPSLVNTYEDHRMAMGFSLVGLRTPGIVIDNPGCCSKTFENYFNILDVITDHLSCDT